MKESTKGSHNGYPINNTAKLARIKDMTKVLDYFRYKVGTTLDAALELSLLRNSVTWYVRDLEAMGVLRAITKRPDSTTGYKAKHYSANPDLWGHNVQPQQLSMFSQKEMEGKR